MGDKQRVMCDRGHYRPWGLPHHNLIVSDGTRNPKGGKANNVKEVKTATLDQSDGERLVDAFVSAEDARAEKREEAVDSGLAELQRRQTLIGID